MKVKSKFATCLVPRILSPNFQNFHILYIIKEVMVWDSWANIDPTTVEGGRYH